MQQCPLLGNYPLRVAEVGCFHRRAISPPRAHCDPYTPTADASEEEHINEHWVARTALEEHREHYRH